MVLDKLQAPSPQVDGPGPEQIEGLDALDPTLLEAAAAGNPLAFDALAGVVDNSVLAALLPGITASDERAAPQEAASLASASGASGKEARVEIDRDLGDPEGGERRRSGSGEHGRLDPGVADYANHAFWRGVAVSASGYGLPNAARHMHHFLGNSGSRSEVDAEAILLASSAQKREFERARMEVLKDAQLVMEDADTTKGGSWTMQTPRSNDAYINRADSEDWFFAVGGNTTWMDAAVRYVPDDPESGYGWLQFRLDWNIFDRYDWDEGKKVKIIEDIEVSDETLGRLHVVGLAREFEVFGKMDASFEFRVVPEDAPRYPNQLPEIGGGQQDVEPGRE